ncbi:MAG TPA: lipid A export permease/ATP-binding protein MsbA [Desulfuromonadales bacterium]|nr:lipid A export permease/ATP-binding protein MsbA [Desulfuromonadales bacterium]
MVKNTNWTLMKRLLGYSRRYLRRILIAGVASLGVAGTEVATAKLIQPFVDNLLIEPDPALINLLPMVVIGLALVKGVSRYVQGYCIQTAGQFVVQDLRNELYDHSIGLSMRYFSGHSSNDVLSRFLNNISLLQRSATDDIIELVRESLTLVGLTALVFYTDVRLALVAFLVLPVSVLPAAMIGKKIKEYTKRGMQSIARVTGVLQETLAGIKVVKAFGTEDYERQRFHAENRSYLRQLCKVLKYDAAAKPVVELVASLGAAAVLWFGILRVVDGHLSPGEFSTFLAAMFMMYGPVKRLTKVYANLQRSFGAADRVFELMDEPYDVEEAPDAVDLGRSRGEVSFRNVNFAYLNQPVLIDFTIDARAGEVVALVGPSGAGKSTVVGLLARFYDPLSGSISVDDQDIRNLTLKSLKDNLAFVDQETVLFNTTISDNIRYGSPKATDAQVREAAVKAYADGFIEQLEEGYETNIGDRGVRLSGGQRQRICIARAILRDAPILILDEATSALDTESEIIVQRALANLMQNRTTFVIAHRLTTVMNADRIVVLEDGQIREIGRHEELLQADGLYRRLYQMQFRDDTE